MKQKKQENNQAVDQQQSKKSYSAPKLTHHGSIATIVEAGISGTGFDGTFPNASS